jgi:hypothetical protein
MNTSRFVSSLFRRRSLVLAALALPLISFVARADEAIYERVLRGSVLIMTNAQTMGSGSLIDTQHQLVLTNFHVVNGASAWQVHFAAIMQDGRPVQDLGYYMQRGGIPARVVAADPRRDLAILQLSQLPPGASALPLASRGATPGAHLHLIGNGAVVGALFGYEDGTVRTVSRQCFQYATGQTVDTLIVASTLPTNPGDSGAAIVNDAGEIVAVNHSSRGNAQIVSCGTDVTEVRAFLVEVGVAGGGRIDAAAAAGPGPGRLGGGEVVSRTRQQQPPIAGQRPSPSPLDREGAASGTVDELQRLMTDGPNRQRAIRDGVTSNSGVLRARTLQFYFRHCSPLARQAIGAALMGGDGPTRVAGLEALTQIQRSLAAQLQELHASIVQSSRQSPDEAGNPARLNAAMNLARQLVEVTDAIEVGKSLIDG